ncbi:MAG: hypothetical protein ABW208_13445 [Pyrinomonadaceae bacterium]
MKGNEHELSRKKLMAVAALVTSPTVKEAAAKSGVGESTLRRWLAKDEKFSLEVREAQRQALDLAILRAQAIADEAVTTLEAIHTDTTKPANARVAAARYLDSRRIPLAELGDIRQQIKELKELYEQVKRER